MVCDRRVWILIALGDRGFASRFFEVGGPVLASVELVLTNAVLDDGGGGGLG